MQYIDELVDIHGNQEKMCICSDNGISLSYRELKSLTYIFAGQLIARGIKNKDRIIVLMNNSIEAIISFMSILKSGATYIPINPEISHERIKHVLNCSAPVLIIISAEHSYCESIQKEFQTISTIKIKIATRSMAKSICVNGEYLPAKTEQIISVEQVQQKRSQEDTAYVIFTSGSTGKQKGVMISHKSLITFVETISNVLPYSAKTKYLGLFPFYFDASIVDIYPVLYNEGTLFLQDKVVIPSQIFKNIERYEISFTCLPSTIVKLLASKYLDVGSFKLDTLETIWYGTEACPRKIIRLLQDRLPHVQFVHGYGPTEVTCTSHVYFIDKEPDGQLTENFPIGKPLPSVAVLALNHNGELIKPCEVGELYLGGPQVMQGYCDKGMADDRVLLKGLLNCGTVMYKTGDYVTVDTNGYYYFIGRKDDMVKIRGNLVCLSEVEASIVRFESVQDAIAIPYEGELGILGIKAFIMLSDGETFDSNGMNEHLKSLLPNYMLPDRFVVLEQDKIPLNENGKIDRKRLTQL